MGEGLSEAVGESPGCAGCLGCLGTIALLMVASSEPAILVVGGGLVAAGFALSALGRHSRIRSQIRRGVNAYLAGDPDAVSAVHGHALGLLRQRVQAHRDRMLGPDSEWGRARGPLEEALIDAHSRLAYWRERLLGEPDSEIASLQLETALKLHDKLKKAVDEVDDRAAVLRHFYDRCEAKLAVMDRSNSDLVEVKRLEELSGRTNTVIADARGAIEGLAQRFLAEARSIATALGSADRTQLGVLAGDAPIDNIEFLADKIHESRERDRGTIEALEKTLT